MIVITVQNFNGQPIAGISASFDELGGTIGRADNNQLVLADPDRSISRVHAQVVYRNGGWAVVDRGSNPVQVNGRPVGNGREAAIRDGDTLVIGGYQLAVTVGQKTVSPDPFADLFGAGGTGKPAPAPAAGSAADRLFADPLAPPPATAAPVPAPPAYGAPAAYRTATPRVEPSIAAAAPAARGAGGGVPALPDDWDPFAPAPAASALGDLDTVRNPYRTDPSASPPSRSDSLDDLFGLDGSRSGSVDPFAGSPLAAPLAQPNTYADADPLRAFGITPDAAPAPVSDHVSDLQTPWQAAPLRDAGSADASPLQGAVLSWNQPSRAGKVVTLPGGRPGGAEPMSMPQATVPPMPQRSAADADEPGALTRIIPRGNTGQAPTSAYATGSATGTVLRSATALPSASPPAVPAALAGNAGADAEELRRALAEGLGIPAQRLRPLDAQQMHLLGSLLRESTRGVVDLLVARAALKREMRTDVTMIAVRENNPLKFSPSVEVALQHLLGDPMPGFMPSAPAMRDAFDDLRAHQLGVMAGMRAALDGVLQRFEPAQLEGTIAAKRSALSALLPSTRKAQLWEAFQQLYAQLSAEAADDFQELFGKAFRKAYEAHIDELQSPQG